MAKYRITPSSKAIMQLPISIGHKAEKGVEAIEFDVTAWVETYGSGALTVIMRRWGDAIPYPIALEIDENNKATWTLSDIDTAKAGMAYAQLSYIVGETVVKKSDIYTFRVMDSLTGEGDPPEAYESWLEHLTHLAAEAMAEVLDIEGIVTDKTLTVDGGIADAKATGEALAGKVDAADHSELSARVGANTIALAEKADRSTTYTKAQVDQMIEDVEVETDTTLSVTGKPADAKKTGDEITALKADLDAQTGIIRLVKDYYINTSTTPISLTPIPSSAGRMSAVVACSTGDKFVINAYSDSAVARAWCFIDNTNNAISMADYNATVTDLELTAPENAAKLIINDMRGGMSYKIGNNLASRVSEIAFSNDAKAALLACFKHVAWTDKHGQDYYDELESALGESGSYWDYEWYATSGTLPEGMTANAYDFSTVPGALHVEHPNMDFDYIGDIRLYIECSLYTLNPSGIEIRQSNPQIIIKHKVVSEDQFKGCKVIASPTQESTFYIGFGVNGTTKIINGIASMDIHAYDISAINGVYSLTIDGTEISITQNDNTTPYINYTGIMSSDGLPPTSNRQTMNIKCIKYKKL